MSKAAMTIRLLASTAAATHGSKRSNSLDKAALHSATTRQHGDAALDAGAKALALLEWCTLLVRLALGSLLATALWNGHHVDAAAFA